jgi:hypothetical protein
LSWDWADSDPATKWANDVVGGRIVTKLMPLAAERHLRDKERTDIIWRKDKARRCARSGHNISSRLSFALSRRKQGFESGWPVVMDSGIRLHCVSWIIVCLFIFETQGTNGRDLRDVLS